MSQLIYIVLAMLLVMLLMMNTQRGVNRTARDQTLNEVQTQLTGVATEVLERIGRTHFDRYAASRYDAANPETHKPYCGRIAEGQETAALTAPADFGTTGVVCGSFAACPYIEGFHGLDTTVTRGDFVFHIDSIRVEYVDPDHFASASASQTFAKRVSVTVENPFLYLGDDPANTFALTMSRVFTYGCVTDPNAVPYLRPAPQDPGCPVSPCSVSY